MLRIARALRSARSLTCSQARGKKVFVSEMNASISKSFRPQCVYAPTIFATAATAARATAVGAVVCVSLFSFDAGIFAWRRFRSALWHRNGGRGRENWQDGGTENVLRAKRRQNLGS